MKNWEVRDKIRKILAKNSNLDINKCSEFILDRCPSEQLALKTAKGIAEGEMRMFPWFLRH